MRPVICIFIPTRNRLEALIDSLDSVKRVKILNPDKRLSVVIQDNSDVACPSFIIDYFRRDLEISYEKNDVVLSMRENMNEGVIRCLQNECDSIVFLTDRRLLTTNIIEVAQKIRSDSISIICFDHQSVWVNSKCITHGKYEYQYLECSEEQLIYYAQRGQVSWRQPILQNCVIKPELFWKLNNRYGSYIGGFTPDMDFLARCIDIGIARYKIFDGPCTVTNARHVNKSLGTNGHKTSDPRASEHYRLSGEEEWFPRYLEFYALATITGSLQKYWSNNKVREFIHGHEFGVALLRELSYPMSRTVFDKMQHALRVYCEEFKLGDKFMSLVDTMGHCNSNEQRYPIDASPHLWNRPDLNLLSAVELRN